MTGVRAAVAAAFRDQFGLVVAATVRVARDLDLAEECAQEAFTQALVTWERDGVPANPAAWLVTTARRRAIDALRREATLRSKLPLIAIPDDSESPGTPYGKDHEIADDRLRLVFTCCHPALAREAQVALTLRLVCGVSTPDIARAFLVSEPTMAARVTRAKKKIAAAGIPFRVPRAAELPERLHSVLTVVHLLYTTGHTAPTGDALQNTGLADRALHLCRTLRELMPDEPEVAGLLALLLLTDARRATRTDASGRLVRLEDQDRSLWNQAAIAEGRTLILQARQPGRFILQAAIAALHTEALTYGETDWPQIVTLYDRLAERWPSPVVALNRAVAVSMADGPDAGLRELAALANEPTLADYHYLPAIKADLLSRSARYAEAATAYEAALTLVENAAERAFLSDRLRTVRRFCV